MKNLRDMWWVGVAVAILYPITQLARGVHLSWGFELSLLVLLLVPLAVFAVQSGMSLPRRYVQHHVAHAPRQPIQWPQSMLMATYVFGGFALLAILVFAFTGKTMWLKAAILLALATSAAGFIHQKGSSFLSEHWKEIWLLLSLVWIAWVIGFGFQSWKELILPALSITLALIVVLGVTREVTEATGAMIVWVIQATGKVLLWIAKEARSVLTGGYGKWTAAFAHAVVGITLFVLFSSWISLIYGGIATLAIFMIPGKELANRAVAR